MQTRAFFCLIGALGLLLFWGMLRAIPGSAVPQELLGAMIVGAICLLAVSVLGFLVS